LGYHLGYQSHPYCNPDFLTSSGCHLGYRYDPVDPGVIP